MGVGLELLFLIPLFLLGGYLIYWAGFRKKAQTQPNRGTDWLRWVSLGVGILLLILVAINLEFCSHQANKMDKNSTEDNSIDNIGKGENERD